MRGITPVIAIILLLLMAVAAAGGFYFVYQNFASSGEESGSSQIDALGEQTLSQIKIESAAGGRLYIRNTGATTIDASKLSVFVEDVPVEVNRSSDTLAENSRATLKLTQVPTCTSERCEVKVSGPASTTQTIDLAKLLCSTDSDCLPSESCSGGLCVTTVSTSSSCGDDTCDYPDETGMTCWQDCGFRKLPWADLDLNGDYEIYSFDWNGSTFVKGQNLTANTRHDIGIGFDDDSEGNMMFLGITGPTFAGTCPGSPTEDHEVMYAYYDGSWTVGNITDNDWTEGAQNTPVVFNSSGDAMAVWFTGDSSKRDITWSSFDGSSWSAPENITRPSDDSANCPFALAFGSDDTGILLWSSSDRSYLNYSVWDDGWSEPRVLADDAEVDDYGESTVAFNSTHAMAAWHADFPIPSPDGIVQYSVWDGSAWTTPENVSDNLAMRGWYKLQFDENGNGVLVGDNRQDLGAGRTWLEYAIWDGSSWTEFANLTEPNLLGFGGAFDNRYGAIAAISISEYALLAGMPSEGHFSYWNGTGWSERGEFVS